MADSSRGEIPDTKAIQQLHTARQVMQQPDMQAVHNLYWRQPGVKRSAPTPVSSTAHTPAETAEVETAMEVEQPATGPQPTEGTAAPSYLQPFAFEKDAAISVTAGALGVDINDHNAVRGWLQAPVSSNQQVFDMVRAYHENVIRPEYYALVTQLEAGLKNINDQVFHVRKEVAWMAADNRLAQKYACGTQLLTVGWPTGMAPKDRNYMIGWLLSQTQPVVEFLRIRGNVSDHNAQEMPRYLNALTMEPTTVPQGGDFYSTMTLLSFKSWDLRKSVLEKWGGNNGIPIYKDEATPVHGKHLKIAPCSPQWQRKLESPIRVVLSAVNAHPDHNATSQLRILWKTLTIMEPALDNEWHPDLKAWARVHYYSENGEFKGRLEIVDSLKDILMSPPTEREPGVENLWQQHWNKVMWGNQLELDQADAAAMTTARAQAGQTGKGLQLGKGKRHWSNTAIHTSDYEPYPFELVFVTVDAIYFSWDELCDKCGKQEEKVGDYGVATIQGKPPMSVVQDLTTTQGQTAAAPSNMAPPSSVPPKRSGGKGRNPQA